MGAVFVVEPDEAALAETFVTEAEVAAVVLARWLYGRWLAEQPRGVGLPVLAPWPWGTLADRIAATATVSRAGTVSR